MIPKSEAELIWRDINAGGIVIEAGSASQYRTGAWRSRRPVIDQEKCTRCGLCYLYCPEGSIVHDKDGHFDVDLYYCKGCGICAEECAPRSIRMEEEEEG
jgi:pyruvate ferredoxin oxidoreductase delta subunit